MKFTKLLTSISLTVGSVLFVANSAQAASFTSNFTQNKGTRFFQKTGFFNFHSSQFPIPNSQFPIPLLISNWELTTLIGI